MLADVQLLTKDIDSLIEMFFSVTSIAPYETQQSSGVDIWPMFGSMLDPIKNKLVTLDTEASAVIANGYTLETDPTVFTKFPLVLGTSGGQYYVTVDVKGKFGNFEARALKVVANLGIALIENIDAHDLTIDLTSAMNNLSGLMELLSGLTGGASSSTDVVKALRGLGWLLADNPKFLAKSSTRWNAYMADVPARYIAAIDALRELDADLIATAKPTADECKAEVACLISSDTAINTGDQLLINAVAHAEINMTVSDMLNTLNALKPVLSSTFGIILTATSTQITVDVDLTNSNILAISPILMNPFGRIIPALDPFLVKVEDSINNGTALGPADINPMITALDPTLPTLPDGLFSVSIKPILNMPFRDLVGYFKCDDDTLPGTGNHCLAIETEQVNVGDQCGTDSWCGRPYYAQGDSGHFSGVKLISSKYPDGISINIGPDGVAPKACILQAGSTMEYHLISTKNLFYLGLGDTTLNGALRLDLSKLPAPFNANEPSGLSEPGNYEINKLINWMIVDYAQRVEDADISKVCRTYIDLLPLDIIPQYLTNLSYRIIR